MRGEERVDFHATHRPEELPPHARRRGAIEIKIRAIDGITSACAEKRAIKHLIIVHHRNYLRMRGEEHRSGYIDASFRELPPHARRRAWQGGRAASPIGITSACAEKSQCYNRIGYRAWNYLRMRGEELDFSLESLCQRELPPHARRRDATFNLRKIGTGITSACAEKSWIKSAYEWVTRNYLRMRGEETAGL